MENKKTAVEWLIESLIEMEYDLRLIPHTILRAKKLEKEQMHKCASFWRGKENAIEKPIFEQYYNETFKTKQDENTDGQND